MDVIVTVEQRFGQTANGQIFTPTQFPYAFWRRYLAIFDHVRVIARVQPIEAVPSSWQQADGEGVTFVNIPYYLGPRQYISQQMRIHHSLKAIDYCCHAVILRVPSQIANNFIGRLYAKDYPFGVEVVADPFDVFAPGTIRHPLRAFFRRWFYFQLRRQSAQATAAVYVTKDYLQKRYPTKGLSLGGVSSCVEISNAWFVPAPRFISERIPEPKLIFVGSLEHSVKGADTLLRAVALLIQEGLSPRVELIGDGQERPKLERLADELGIRTQVHFAGQLPGARAVRERLDLADLFVLPSRTEGLPRAIIEAMARALPCVASNVGGIPDLLSYEDMVPPNQVNALADKLREVLTDPERMTRMSAGNLQKAIQYSEEALQSLREKFYSHVKTSTLAWLRQHANTSP